MSTLQSGSYVGCYEILAQIGVGGMGEVYRARDTKLKRDVAIKILPSEWAQDPDRLARFQREAEVLASLNHPHIAQIYGQDKQGDVRCLVLELIDGETLQERLRHGAIPVEEALKIGRQIADALAAAHERGIVHRDLKPANIKITSAGLVKVLDFGLAKTVDPQSGTSLSSSPTFLSSAAHGRAILGTAAYMSPEQANGKPADTRSDIWAFGVVLCEMLTGKTTFGGETITEILSSVLKSDPDWTALPGETPPLVRSLLRRCLQKDLNRRMGYMADVRIEIEEALIEMESPAVLAPPARVRSRLWMTMSLLVVAIAAIAAALYLTAPSGETSEIRLNINTPRGGPANFAISPDGRNVVFQATTTDGRSQLSLRRLQSEASEPLAGTEGATHPFWSPDSRSIGFFANGRLKRIDLGGGAALELANAALPLGGTWNSDGVIVFASGPASALQRVMADGSGLADATLLDGSRQLGHRFPDFLPDGRHFLYYATGTAEDEGVYVGSLDSTETRWLVKADAKAVFAEPDHLLFVRQGTLFAQRLDLQNFELSGNPFAVAEGIATSTTSVAEAAFSASAAGSFAYRANVAAVYQLLRVDRSGKQIGAVGGPISGLPDELRLSPDGQYAAMSRAVNGNLDVWLIEIARGVLRRVTTHPAWDRFPVWSSDSSSIMFSSRREGSLDLYQIPLSTTGGDTLLLKSPEAKDAYDWSPDNRYILYAVLHPDRGRDIWAVPLEGDRTPFPVAQTAFNEQWGRFSPDGRWVAYQSNESGRAEIWVRPFPEQGRSWQISTSGGAGPEWRHDGREILYATGNRLMAAPVTLNTDNQTVEAGIPVPLFTLAARGPLLDWAASPDGQTFLINTLLEEAPPSPITVVLNWTVREQ